MFGEECIQIRIPMRGEKTDQHQIKQNKRRFSFYGLGSFVSNWFIVITKPDACTPLHIEAYFYV